MGIVSSSLDLVAVGGEVRVNTTTNSDQQFASVTGLNGGGFVVTWMSDGQDGSGYGVYGQRYDASGAADGSEFLINTTTAGAQISPSVTALNDGGFVVTWVSHDQDGSGYGVYGQRYDASGAADDGEFLINTTTANAQLSPSVTALNDGGFVVTWRMFNGHDGSGSGVYGQRFDAAGAADGSEFRINTTTAGAQISPSVTALNDGGFVVTWEFYGHDVRSWGVSGQRYDASGAADGGEFLINTTASSEQLSPSVTALNDGGFVVIWKSDGQDGSGYGVYGQRYDASGAADGSEFRINTTTVGNQNFPSLTALNDGGFVVTWVSDGQDGSGYGVYGQRFDAAGAADGSEFLINTTTAGSQLFPSLTALNDGGFVVTWQSPDQDGDGDGIYSQRYEPSGTFTVSATGTSGDDNMVGGLGPDTLDGLAGNDTLLGNDGNDVLDGGDGNDELRGGEGADTLIGGEGDDVIVGGETDADLRDVVYGGNGNDSIEGGYGNDELRGEAGNDSIAGGFGVDTVIGNSGNDTLTGGAYSDLLFGGDGFDFINGGFGHDRVNGGAGADQFYHLGITDHGSDWIQDYNAAEGDVLMWGGAAATAWDFQINMADTANAGVDGVSESFIIYIPTEQIIWALVDGETQSIINIQIGDQTFDLLA
jgi:Ca2+-binding RTX toxin-like protein